MAVTHNSTTTQPPLSAEHFAHLMASYYDVLNDCKHIAVAVSGGGDSMALAHLLYMWCNTNNKKLHILTVDHGLRAEAKEEALQVKKWTKDWQGCEHHILTWQHEEKPQSRLQESARNARYEQLANYCQKHEIKALFIAHHADDQYETFLMRLTAGSGLKGLCSMPDITHDKEANIYKIRPLLGYKHQDLLQYCRENSVSWIEDPSNENDDFKRIRFRKSADFLTDEGLSAKRVETLISRIKRARSALDYYADKELENLSLEASNTKYIIDLTRLKTLPDEISLLILNNILMALQGQTMPYPPNSEKLESLHQRILSEDDRFNGATLYKCQFAVKNKRRELHISKEA